MQRLRGWKTLECFTKQVDWVWGHMCLPESVEGQEWVGEDRGGDPEGDCPYSHDYKDSHSSPWVSSKLETAAGPHWGCMALIQAEQRC